MITDSWQEGGLGNPRWPYTNSMFVFIINVLNVFISVLRPGIKVRFNGYNELTINGQSLHKASHTITQLMVKVIANQKIPWRNKSGLGPSTFNKDPARHLEGYLIYLSHGIFSLLVSMCAGYTVRNIVRNKRYYLVHGELPWCLIHIFYAWKTMHAVIAVAMNGTTYIILGLITSSHNEDSLTFLWF